MKWTDEQQACIDAARAGESFSINAVAGGAKTTTGVECISVTNKPGLALAFNKAIATTLQKRVRPGIEAKTFNGLGHTTWGNHIRKRLVLEENKYFELLAKQRGGYKWEDKIFHDLLRIIDLLRNNGYVPKGMPYPGISSSSIVEDICVELDISPSPKDLQDIDDVIRAGIVSGFHGTIDFTDQLYLPIIAGASFTPRPFIFVDEAQDLNLLQHKMILKLRPEQAIVVGDPNQAIYAWRGAYGDSMETLEELLSLPQKQLTFTFRCPRSAVALAQQIVPRIRCPEWAKPGFVAYSDHAADAVICRNNAPLIARALYELSRGNPVRFKDAKKLDKILSNLMKKVAPGPLPMPAFLDRLNNYFINRQGFLKSQGKFSAIDRLADTCACLRAVAEGLTNSSEILPRLAMMFKGNAGPWMLTIHGSKGLEFERVHLLGRNLLPSQFATTELALQQEDNLLYVGLTRTLNELYITEVEA